MARNIQVNLTFSADTNAAKTQLQQLQQSLSNLTSNVNLGGKITAEMQQSINKVNELKVALNNATNVDTGKLNFGKFSQELKANKIQLQDYAQHLAALGPQGVQAFTQLTRAVQLADTSLFSIQGQIRKLGTTMANTIRWQITSGLTTGLVSAFRSVIDYAEELNESLNNIRIVTGKSTDEMSKFAKEASKAAKNLSTTTTDYTDAALIYYQQGLKNDEVKQRTNTTVKLANVTGESAETVSEWMTAIWNNFDDGSKSLEYYADVLAALGAATASSADEIAGGLEKFAAISDTVGLSYEYAAAALATITAETRQSEDVVGTSLKTIFSRIENLQLGETLEDGTDLGQYSEALMKVGVNIKDSNGELKDMDIILDQIGSRWNTLARDEQVALAQSVAGIRQYNQFMALMSNWDVMENNLAIIKDSTGELQKQQMIYEQGIEGAQARVQLQLDNIKNSLLDENDLIPLLDTAESFLEIINNILDSIGGLKGLLLIVSNILLNTFNNQIVGIVNSLAASFAQVKNGLMGISAEGAKSSVTSNMTDTARNIALQTQGEAEGVATSHILQQNAEMAERRAAAEEKISAFNKESLNLAEQQITQAQEEYLALSRQTDELQEQYELKRNALSISGVSKKDVNELERSAMQQGRIEQEMNYSMKGNSRIDAYGGNEKYAAQFGVSKEDSSKLKEAYKNMEDARTKFNTAVKNGQKDLTQERKAVEKSRKEYVRQAAQLSKSGKAIDKIKTKYKGSEKAIDSFVKATKESDNAHKKTAQSLNNLNGAVDNYNQNIDNAITQGKTFSETFVASLSNVASAAMGFNMVTSSIEAMFTSFREGNTTIGSLISNLASLAMGFTFLYGAIEKTNLAQTLGNFLLENSNKLTISNLALKLKEIVVTKTVAAAHAIWNGIKKIGLLFKKQEIKETEKETKAKTGLYIVEAAGKVLAGDYGSAAIALGLLGIGAIAGAGTSISVGAEEKEQAQTDEANDTVSKVHEEYTKTADLGDQFNSLYDNFKKTGEGSDDLLAKAKELNAVLNDQSIALQILSKDFDGLASSIDSAMAAEAQKAAEQSSGATQHLYSDFRGAMREGTGRETYDTYKADFNAGGLFSSKKDEKGLVATMEAANKEFATRASEVGVSGSLFDAKNYNLNPVPNTIDGYMLAYEALDWVYTNASKYSSDDYPVSKSEVYQQIGEWLSKSREQYQSLKTAYDNTKTYTARSAVRSTKSAQGNPISQITDLEEYTNTVNNTLSGVNESDKDVYIQEFAAANPTLAAKWQDMQTLQAEGVSQRLVEKVYFNHSEEIQNAMAMIDAETLKKIGDNEKLLWDEIDKNLTKAAKQSTENAFKAFNYDSKDAELYVQFLKSQNPLLQKNEVAANRAAKANLLLQEGFKSLTKVWDDNKESLDSMGADYAVALNNISDSLKNLYGITDADFSLASVIASNRPLLDEFMAGSETAYYELTNTIAGYMAETYGIGGELLTLIENFNSTSYDLGESVNTEGLIQGFNDAIDSGVALTNVLAIIQQMGMSGEFDAQGNLISLTYVRSAEAISAQLKERKKASEKNKKYLDEEIERYHEIKEELEDIEKALNRISSAKDRAFGKSKIQLIEQEIAAIDKDIDAQDRYIEEIKQNYSKDLTELNKWGFSTDESGRITNYDEVMAKQIKAYNSSSNKEKADEKWEEFEAALSNYEETLDLLEDAEDDRIEKGFEKRSKELEKITTEVETFFELTEMHLSDIEFQLGQLDDTAYDTAESMALMAQKAQAAYDKAGAAGDGIRKLLGENTDAFLSGDYSNLTLDTFTAEEIEQLNTWKENLYESAEIIQEMDESIRDGAVQGFISLSEEAAGFGEELRHNQSIIQSFQNIIDLVGKDNLGLDDAFMDSLAERNKKIAADALSADRMAYETTLENYNKAVASGLYDEDQLEEMWAQVEATQSTYMDSWATALETMAEEFDNKVQRIIDKYDEAMGGLADKIDQLAKMKETDDFFLKDYEKTYEISKLSRTISENMDKTINARGKQQLAELNEQLLAYQREGKEMSDYDLQYLQKKYELTQAQIALEEAQNAKSQVRLTRDSEGNFGYTYTADQGAIDKAQQTYEDKIYGMEKFLDQSSEDIASRVLDLQNKMNEELAGLDKNAEDYEERASEIVSHYSGLISNLMDEAVDMVQYGKEINEEYGTHAAETFKETILGKLYSDLTSFEELEGKMNTAIQGTLSDLITAHQDFEDDVELAMNNAGTSVSGFKDDATKDLGDVDQKVQDLNKSVEDMPSKFNSAFSGINNELDAWLGEYRNKFAPYIKEVTDLGKEITNLISYYSQLAKLDLGQFELKVGATYTDATGNLFEFTGDGWKPKTILIEQPSSNPSSSGNNIPELTAKDVRNNYATGFSGGSASQITIALQDSSALSYSAYNTASGKEYIYYTLDSKGNLVPLTNFKPSNKYSFNPEDDAYFYNGEWYYNTSMKDGQSFVFVRQNALSALGAETPDQYNMATQKSINEYGETVYTSKNNYNGGSYTTIVTMTMAEYEEWLRKRSSYDYEMSNRASFDTGGYTGEWGPEGRLAMLHQKEIVLNAHDTENLLTSVEIVRAMADKLEQNARIASMGLSEIVSVGRIAPAHDTLEQNVTIHAEFPNATDKDSIREAFGDLVNLAAQYANRR